MHAGEEAAQAEDPHTVQAIASLEDIPCRVLSIRHVQSSNTSLYIESQVVIGMAIAVANAAFLKALQRMLFPRSFMTRRSPVRATILYGIFFINN